MSGNSVIEIDVSSIVPSPFQHRRMFDVGGLNELARSIETDGLIQPITVRPVSSGFELIAGERRWRAAKIAKLSTIAARVLEVNDLQARRLCATENLQRADLTAVEEIMALAELVDASLMIEFDKAYSTIGNVQEPKWRVRTLLMKLDSDNKHGTDYFGNKFVPKVETLFAGLPKPKNWLPFYRHDLSILFTPDEVQQFALDQRLNKSQTKAVAALQEAAPEAFREIVKSAPEQAATRIMNMADPFSMKERDDEPLSLSDLSAETIKTAARNAKRQPELIEAHNHRAQGTGENEWYTPNQYIEMAREVMGVIDLDPATSQAANRIVNAERIFTVSDNGLTKKWNGNVWMNPPYSQPDIQLFIEKLVKEYREARIDQAVVLTHNYTDTAWFHIAAEWCSAICFTRGRIGFVNPEGIKAAPTQGQAFFYFGGEREKFSTVFGKIGFVVNTNE